MEIRGYAPDLLQRMPGQTGGDAVDASWQLVAHGSRQVRPQALQLLALECAASVGVCITYGAQCDIREAQFNSTNRAISRCCARSCARNSSPTLNCSSSRNLTIMSGVGTRSTGG